MVSYSSLVLVLSLSFLALKMIIIIVKNHRLRKLMPPGPPGLPLLGNIFQVGSSQWLQFTKWKDQYGPIISLNLAGQLVVVLNDLATTTDLIDRRSSIYSNRPRFIMANEILTKNLAIGMMPYGDIWRRMRRATHAGFNSNVVFAYHDLQQKSAALLVSKLLQDPTQWDDHLRWSAADTMLRAIYGRSSVTSDSQMLVTRINDFMHRVMYACLPGSFLVDIFPSMLFLPNWMAKWKREGQAWHNQDTQMFIDLFSDVQARMGTDGSKSCFVQSLIQDGSKYDLSVKESAWLAGSLFGAGAETTAAALAIFVVAMVLNPDVVRRAQAEVDAVVGQDRLPSFDDRTRLPYIDALVKEVNRWRPVGPLGVPRRSTEDDWYRGYFIPKDTIVLLNVWAMNRDPDHFPDYDAFRPERYLDEAEELAAPMPNTHGQGHMTFGSGRRICAGKDLANQSLFIDIATIIWAFDIAKALDANGEAITPSLSNFVEEGIVVRPVPFECSITPRSSKVVSIIQSAVSKA